MGGGAADTARLLQIYGPNRFARPRSPTVPARFRGLGPLGRRQPAEAYGEAIVARMQHYLAREHRRHPDGVVQTTLAKPGEEDVVVTSDLLPPARPASSPYR